MATNTIPLHIFSLNKVLAKIGSSYNNFYLFDDVIALSNMKARVLKDYPKYTTWTDDQIKAAKTI